MIDHEINEVAKLDATGILHQIANGEVNIDQMEIRPIIPG